MPMTLINRTTLTGNAATVTFNSIPQTYQTLKLLVSSRTDQSTAKDLIVSFNTSTANLTMRYVIGTGSATSSGSGTTGQVGNITGTGQTASVFSSTEIVFPNYAGSTNKAFASDDVFETNGSTAYLTLFSNLWSNKSAISTIGLNPSSGNFVSGCTFSLYGIS